MSQSKDFSSWDLQHIKQHKRANVKQSGVSGMQNHSEGKSRFIEGKPPGLALGLALGFCATRRLFGN
jgi:hypothetical protein